MKAKYLWLVRKSLRALRHRKMRHRPWWRRLTKPLFDRHLWKPCRDTVASGAAIGSFFAVMPVPAQSIAAALVTMKCKGNIPFAVGFCFLSNPFTNVPIWSAQLWLGKFIQDHVAVPMPSILCEMEATLPGLGPVNARGFIVGSVASGCLLAAAAFGLVRLIALVLPLHLPTRIKLRKAAVPKIHPRKENDKGVTDQFDHNRSAAEMDEHDHQITESNYPDFH
jgi:uncharacterized protein (DUF2062 family)